MKSKGMDWFVLMEWRGPPPKGQRKWTQREIYFDLCEWSWGCATYFWISWLWAGGPSTAHQLIPQSTLIVSFMLLALPLLINERDEPSPKSIFYFFLCWMSKDGRNVVNWLSEMGWKLITNHCAIKKDLSFLWSRQLTIHQFTIPSIK